MNTAAQKEGVISETLSGANNILQDLETLKGGIDKGIAHIKHLEDTLKIAEEVCIDRIGIERGYAEIARLALDALATFDPSNPLLDPNYRQMIGTRIRQETVASFSKGKGGA